MEYSKGRCRQLLGILVALLIGASCAPPVWADTLQLEATYVSQENSYWPPDPYLPFPPYDQGSVRTAFGFSVAPFTARIGDYSAVSVTINAPAGQEFVFHAPTELGSIRFYPNFFFASSGSRRDIYGGTTSLAFSDLRGTAPTLYAYQSNTTRLADTGSFFAVESEYEYSSEFSFTSMTITGSFTLGGDNQYAYEAWDADLYAFANSNVDVGPLAELRLVPQSRSVPEIDPNGLGVVVSILAGVAGMLERRLAMRV